MHDAGGSGGTADGPVTEATDSSAPIGLAALLAELLAEQPWRFTAALVIVLSALFAVVGSVAVQLGPREPFAGSWQELVYSGPLSSLVSHWQRWDALWYQHIATSGYAAGDGSIAFFPLYPLLSRLVSIPLAGNVVLAELVISATACAGALALLWRLVRAEADGRFSRDRPDRPPRTAGRGLAVPVLAVLLTACFPVGFFLFAPFTESLFLLLAIATVYLARCGRPWIAGLAGLLAGLTRTQGVFLALPIAWEVLRDRGTLDWVRRRGGRPPGFSLLAAALPAGGIACFTLYQRLVIGAEKSGVDLLAPWGYTLVLPTDALAAAWGYITSGRGDIPRAIETLNLVALLGAAAVALLGARRLPVAYGLYVLPSLGLLFFREMYFSPLMSASRYVLVLFPCFMIAASWLAPHRKLAAGLVVIGAVLEIVLFGYFARWGFVA